MFRYPGIQHVTSRAKKKTGCQSTLAAFAQKCQLLAFCLRCLQFRIVLQTHGLEVKKVMSETEDQKKTKTPGHMVYPDVPLGSIGCHSSATGGAGFFEKPRTGNALGSRFHKSAELARNSGNYRDESSPRWWFQSV